MCVGFPSSPPPPPPPMIDFFRAGAALHFATLNQTPWHRSCIFAAAAFSYLLPQQLHVGSVTINVDRFSST